MFFQDVHTILEHALTNEEILLWRTPDNVYQHDSMTFESEFQIDSFSRRYFRNFGLIFLQVLCINQLAPFDSIFHSRITDFARYQVGLFVNAQNNGDMSDASRRYIPFVILLATRILHSILTSIKFKEIPFYFSVVLLFFGGNLRSTI